MTYIQVEPHRPILSCSLCELLAVHDLSFKRSLSSSVSLNVISVANYSYLKGVDSTQLIHITEAGSPQETSSLSHPPRASFLMSNPIWSPLWWTACHLFVFVSVCLRPQEWMQCLLNIIMKSIRRLWKGYKLERLADLKLSVGTNS